MKPKVLLLALLAQFLTLSASAYDAEVNGIYYNLDINTRTSEVTYKQHDKYDDYYNNSYTFYSGSVTIPEQITVNSVKYNVTSIGDYAFESCRKLTSVTIPSSITSIGVAAFRGCERLGSPFTIPPSVVYIGWNAFNGCRWLDGFLAYQDGLVYINNVLYCYKGTMEENAKIVLKEGTTCICGGAFKNCYNMASIVIPESVDYIGNSAFEGCNSLKEISFPQRLKIFSCFQTFMGCTTLESIEIPAYDSSHEGRTYSGWTFSGCIGLKTVSFAEGNTKGAAYSNAF